MARIRNTLLSSGMIALIKEELESIRDEIIVDWGRNCLPGGFTKAGPIRERLALMLEGGAGLPPMLLALLRETIIDRSIVRALSLGALEQLEAILAGLLGRDQFHLYLLLDEREEIHKFGAKLVDKGGLPPLDRAEAEEAFLDFLDYHFHEPTDTFPEPFADPSQSMPFPPPAEMEGKNPIKDLYDELYEKAKQERLKVEQERAKQKKHLARIVEIAQREKKRAKAERDEVRAQLIAAQREKADLAASLEKARKQLDEKVATRVREETDQLLRKWLAAPMELEGQLPAIDAQARDLLERAEQTLQAQAKQDRHTGNRLALEGRLKQLEDAHVRLSSAAATAITPLSELKNLLGEVETEIGRIRRLLFPATREHPVADKLLILINNASTSEEARDLSGLVQQFSDLGLLETRHRRKLYQSLQAKFSLLEERSKQKETGDNGWTLRRILHNKQPSLLLLDGYNILFRLTDIFGVSEGPPGKEARQRLIAAIATLQSPRPELRGRIYFDGPVYEELQPHPRLHVVYSGGSGTDRADMQIAAHLQQKSLERIDEKVFVISDDRQVRQEALRLGARYVPVDLFAVLLQDFGCLGKATQIRR